MKVMFAVLTLSLMTLLATAKPAHATTTAGDLQSYCKTAEENHAKGTLTSDNGFCVGFVSSFLQMVSSNPIFRLNGKLYSLTLARSISTGDAVVVFVKYAAAHPEKANDDPANALLFEAFYEAKIVALVPVIENSQIQ